MVYLGEYYPVELINIRQGNYYKGEGITMYNSSGKKIFITVYREDNICLYVIW